MRTVVAFCALAIFAPRVWAQAVEPAPEQALDVIDQCAQATQDESVGFEPLDAECPGLSAAIDALEATAWLSETQREELTRASLADLVSLTKRYRAGAPRTAVLDPESLTPILGALDEQSQDRPPGLLDRLKSWIRALLGRQVTDGSWLERWLRDFNVSRNTVLLIVYVLAALVVVSALGIVFNELRVAGVFGGKLRPRGLARNSFGSGGPGAAALTLSDVDAAPLHERPSLLLRLLLASLAKSGRIRSERSLTHRETIERATFDDAQQRDSFARLASTAESIVYGGAALAAHEIDRVLEGGRALQLQLDSPG